MYLKAIIFLTLVGNFVKSVLIIIYICLCTKRQNSDVLGCVNGIWEFLEITEKENTAPQIQNSPKKMWVIINSGDWLVSKIRSKYQSFL